MLYTIVTTKQYRRAFKRIKHDKKSVRELANVMELLIADIELPKVYKDHPLVGNLKEFRELHIRPNVLLVYQKHKNILVLLLANLGSHSDLF